ncbi:MAG: acyltransferase [Halioglobus sp.]|nr:acyltransferase [Halioglobus sp.]
MKSSTGKYYVGLDHIRGIAAFMVFTWHFVHINNGHLAAPPYFPLSLLTEGHTGVALFMTLSGYLFAKLLAGKNIKFRYFIWNRFLRLAPLLFLVVFIVGVQLILAGLDPLSYAKFMFLGVIKPVLPNGGWSITVEFHFYLILPLLLFMSRKSSGLLMLFVVGAILLRLFLYVQDGSVQNLAYLTIIGRIDQFVFGILAYQYRDFFKGRHLLALAIFLGFSAFFWYFDSLGGFYKSSSYPSPSSVWIYMTTVEGIVYASLIAWYDNSFNHSSGRFSRFLALVGTYSYSIYLLHFFFVFELAKFIDAHVISLSNYYLSMLFAPLAFLVMIPFGWASYRFVESPFLKFRTWYILADKS